MRLGGSRQQLRRHLNSQGLLLKFVAEGPSAPALPEKIEKAKKVRPPKKKCKKVE